MNDDFVAFVVGMFLGIFFMGILMIFVGEPSKREVTLAKEACEQNIPRNQTCILNFVPEKK